MLTLKRTVEIKLSEHTCNECDTSFAVPKNIKSVFCPKCCNNVAGFDFIDDETRKANRKINQKVRDRSRALLQNKTRALLQNKTLNLGLRRDRFVKLRNEMGKSQREMKVYLMKNVPALRKHKFKSGDMPTEYVSMYETGKKHSFPKDVKDILNKWVDVEWEKYKQNNKIAV